MSLTLSMNSGVAREIEALGEMRFRGRRPARCGRRPFGSGPPLGPSSGWTRGASFGASSSVFMITRSTWASVMVRGLPGRGRLDVPEPQDPAVSAAKLFMFGPRGSSPPPGMGDGWRG